MAILVQDSSLRDGNHSVGHKISLESIERYCAFAERVGIQYVEVGHGNGLGGSSLLIGQAAHSDTDMLCAARKVLHESKLAVHIMPGLATCERDVSSAINCGVDVFRVASHCTEATVTKSHIEYLKERGKEVHGVLMMSALADTITLAENAKLLEEYGATAIIIMDSTGSFLPNDVIELISTLCAEVTVDIGFHAHNNLGCAVANSLAAVQAGAKIIDACIRGFGAGAGNTPLELIVPVLERSDFVTGIDLVEVLKVAEEVVTYLVPKTPQIEPLNVLTGLHRIFSGFERPIRAAAKLYNVSGADVIIELSQRKVVAGQEDLILEAARIVATRPDIKGSAREKENV
ncbi:4-hydroxy 2-oxovalerate aldolase [Pycnococcus provasolii]